MKKYAAEMVGTFILVFCCTTPSICNSLAATALSPSGIALTCGAVILALIYALGDISGAHLNPAVSLGFVLAKRMSLRTATLYAFSQLVGALLASLTLHLLFPQQANLGATYPSVNLLQAFCFETILTFFLMFVILNVARGASEKGISAGIAVAATVTVAVLIGAPISGASMNPVRSIAPALIAGNLHAQWVYLTAPFIGAAFAVAIHNAINPQPQNQPTP